MTQTAENTFTGRTITGTDNQVIVSDGDGVSGNPVLSLPQSIHTTANVVWGNCYAGTDTSTTYASHCVRRLDQSGAGNIDRAVLDVETSTGSARLIHINGNTVTISAALYLRRNGTTILGTYGNVGLGSITTTYKLTVSGGSIGVITAGYGLRVKEGTNCKQGTATLVAGTVTVSNTAATASSRIFLTVQSLGTVASPKAIAVTARVAGTSFTITSSDATDTSVVAYEIFEPA
jgi:hypothetical protein